MTYKESLEIAFRYADSTESDFDYKEMFYTLADEAQKLIAIYGRHILRTIEIVPFPEDGFVTVSAGGNVSNVPCSDFGKEVKIQMPDDFHALSPQGIVYADDYTLPVDYKFVGETVLSIVPDDKYTVNYYALPNTIDENTPDDYVYEVDSDTHNAIPYYIAYRLVGTDDITLYQALKNQWDLYLSLFNDRAKCVRKQIRNFYGR